jgi:aryl-alcohol dehydrogenase-like predicted oxidoreductase
MSEDKSVKRRTILKTGLVAAAGTAALGALGTEQAIAGVNPHGSTRVTGEIPARKFGNTGVTLPILGMGGSAMVDVWAPGYGVKLDSIEKRVEMVRYAFDRGVRYFDTARVYSESESIFGRGLKGVRDQAFIASKVAVTKPEQVRPSVEKSLQELDTDHIDLMQIHSPAIEAVGVQGAMKLHAELLKLRDEGMIQFIGLTTHVAFESVHEMISTGGFDQVLLAYGYFRKGMDTLLSNRNIEYRGQCLAKAHELGMAIVSMKIMGQFVMGHNSSNLVPEFDEKARQRLPGAAIRWVAQDHRVSMLIIGISYPGDIDKNIETMTSDLAYTDADRELLSDYAGRAYDNEYVKKMRIV